MICMELVWLLLCTILLSDQVTFIMLDLDHQALTSNMGRAHGNHTVLSITTACSVAMGNNVITCTYLVTFDSQYLHA